jgi:hypothetical protein
MSSITTKGGTQTYYKDKGVKEIYYSGGPHGLTATHQDQVNADLLASFGASCSAPRAGLTDRRR